MKDGYYWVKWHELTEWRIVRIDGDKLFFIGQHEIYYLSDALEIGDYIETPDKYKE